MFTVAKSCEPPIPLAYVESSITPGMTIDAYRRSRPRRVSRWQRLRSASPRSG